MTMERAMVDVRDEFLWGTIDDERLREKWNQLAYAYSPQYHTKCFEKSKSRNELYLLLLMEDQQAVAGGVFSRKSFSKGFFRLNYLEFGIPMAVQCPFIVKHDLPSEDELKLYSKIESAFQLLCKALSVQFVLWKGVRESSIFYSTAKQRWMYLEASPFWHWHHQGNLDTYIAHLNRSKRKSCRRLLRKAEAIGLSRYWI